jgi:6-phosphofructokinase
MAGDTPQDDLLDTLSVSPPTVMVEQMGRYAKHLAFPEGKAERQDQAFSP